MFTQKPSRSLLQRTFSEQSLNCVSVSSHVISEPPESEENNASIERRDDQNSPRPTASLSDFLRRTGDTISSYTTSYPDSEAQLLQDVSSPVTPTPDIASSTRRFPLISSASLDTGPLDRDTEEADRDIASSVGTPFESPDASFCWKTEGYCGSARSPMPPAESSHSDRESTDEQGTPFRAQLCAGRRDHSFFRKSPQAVAGAADVLLNRRFQ